MRNGSQPRRRTGRSAALGAAVTLLAVGASPARAQTAAERAVREAVDAFKAALLSGDADGVVDRLAPDVIVFESGHAETLEEYRSGHLAADIAFLSAVDSETTWETLTVEGDMALYLGRHHTTGRFRDRDIDVRGTETLVLRRDEDGWRIVHVHWSSG